MTRSDAEILRSFRLAGGDVAAVDIQALRAVYQLGLVDAGEREPRPLAQRRWRFLLEAVADRHFVTLSAMLTRGPQGSVRVRALHEAVWLLREHGRLSWPQVGNVVGRHHTVAMDAWRGVEERIAARPGLRDELLGLVGAGERSVAA